MAAHLSVRTQGPAGRRGDSSRLPAGGWSSSNMEEAGQCTAGRSKVQGARDLEKGRDGGPAGGDLLRDSASAADLSVRNGVSAWFLSSQEVGMVAMDKDGALHLLPFQQIACWIGSHSPQPCPL